MTIGEIATVTGRTQVGVRVTLFRARQRLAEAARDAGMVEATRSGYGDAIVGGDRR